MPKLEYNLDKLPDDPTEFNPIFSDDCYEFSNHQAETLKYIKWLLEELPLQAGDLKYTDEDGKVHNLYIEWEYE